MPFPEIRSRQMIRIEEKNDECGLQGGRVGDVGVIGGREVGEEDGAGLEVEGWEERFGHADGGRVVMDVERVAWGEDLDL